MSHLNQTFAFRAPTRSAAQRPTWLQRLASWLQRGWASERRRAERPDRVVPYY